MIVYTGLNIQTHKTSIYSFWMEDSETHNESGSFAGHVDYVFLAHQTGFSPVLINLILHSLIQPVR